MISLDQKSLFEKVIHRLKTEGPAETLLLMARRSIGMVRSYREDLRRGVSTSRVSKDKELGFTNPQYHWYAATDYKTFHTAMAQISVTPGRDVFVDYGSGKGRIVLEAAAYPFAKVIGIEFSELLHETALENVRTAQTQRQCPVIDLQLADATRWEVPPSANVFFFFNPFDGEILAQVFKNLRTSLVRSPRPITIIYVRGEKFFEKEIAWRDWLIQRHRIACVEGTVAIYENYLWTAPTAHPVIPRPPHPA
jgi:16S rRNA G966 N2-methylase RsmD